MGPTSAASAEAIKTLGWGAVEGAVRVLARAYPAHRLSPFPPASPHRAAVAVLLRGDARGAMEVVLIRRGQGAPHHGGELAFPGGMVETSDRDLPATARRELAEELGVEGPLWEVGCLPDGVAKARTRFTPVVFRWEEPAPRYRLNHEVEAVVPLGLRDLLQAPWTTQAITFGGVTHRIPRLDLEPVPLWGATALVLRRLLEALAIPSPADPPS